MDDLIQTLNAAVERLWKALDRALENLEQLRRYLVEKLDRILEFLERIRVLLAKFAWVIARFSLIAAPPTLGLIVAVAMGSPSLFVMVLLLSILIAYAFFGKQIRGETGNELANSALRSSVAPATRLFAIALAAVAIIVAYLVDIGIFIGVLMFVAEFAVVFMLRQENAESLRTQ